MSSLGQTKGAPYHVGWVVVLVFLLLNRGQPKPLRSTMPCQDDLSRLANQNTKAMFSSGMNPSVQKQIKELKVRRRSNCNHLGNEKCARTFFAQTFRTPPGVRDTPAKFSGHPGFLPSKPKEDKLLREGTNFSATAPSRGRPPPHWAVSGPKEVIFVLFFLPDHQKRSKIEARTASD